MTIPQNHESNSKISFIFLNTILSLVSVILTFSLYHLFFESLNIFKTPFIIFIIVYVIIFTSGPILYFTIFIIATELNSINSTTILCFSVLLGPYYALIFIIPLFTSKPIVNYFIYSSVYIIIHLLVFKYLKPLSKTYV